MNTLHDLRSTLEGHAAGIDTGHVGHARVAAVRGRVRRARQRRTAGVVAAAVVVVAGALTVPSLLDGAQRPQPADDRSMLGREAPLGLDSLEYNYGFVEGVESSSIELEPSDEPRLLSWATDAGRAQLEDPYGDRTTVAGTDFDDFVLVEPGESGRWRLRTGGAPAAFAVYEYSGIIPAGDYADGTRLFFRNEVADEVMIDLAGAPRDTSEVTLTFRAPERMFRIAEYCTGVPDDLWVNVSVNGDGAVSSGGCDDDSFDPGAGAGGTYDVLRHGLRPGQPVTVRIWVSDEVDGPVVEQPGVQLALAAYDVPIPATVYAGWELPYEYEYEGHTWRFVRARHAPLGAAGLTLPDRVRGPALALVATGLAESNRYTVSVGRELVSIGGGVGSQLDEVALGPDDEEVTVRVTRGRTPESVIGMAFYRRVD